MAPVVILAAFAAFAAQQIAPPPVPAPQSVTVRNEITVQAPPPDPQAIADASVESSRAILVGIVAPPPVQWANSLLDLPDLWRTTPADLTYEHPLIRQIADQLRVAAFALLALALFVAGASRALGHSYSLEWGRIVFAAFLSLGELVWWEIGIRANNAITAGLSAPTLPSLVQPHLELPQASAVEAIGTVVLVVIYAVVAILTLVSLIFRLGLLEILIALGPLALLCFATEQSEGFAQTYVRMSTGLLFSQVLVVLGLKLAAVLSGVGTGLGGTLIGIVVLLLIRSLPSMLMNAPSPHTGASRLGLLLLVRRALLRF